MLEHAVRDQQVPIQGKTFSLFGKETDTAGYYDRVSELADTCLRQCPDARQLLAHIQKVGGKKRFLKKEARKPGDHSLTSFILHNARAALSEYTTGVAAHLRDESIFTLGDSILSTTEEQYHLYMLEIELANRAFADDFKRADVKLAFLPHCLRDLERACRARVEPGAIDYACKGCSKQCSVNRVGALLKSRDVSPYIWMEADLEDLFKRLRAEGVDFGVLGVACVPELVEGMRLCMQAGIPVIGIPLNANRCARWMGELHETSVDLRALERLIS